MVGYSIRTEGGKQVAEFLLRIAKPDIRPLLETIALRLASGSRRDRVAGMGLNRPLDDIRESTVRRRRQRGRGQGPPLLPDDSGSFAELTTEIQQTRENAGIVVGSYPLADLFIKYLQDGTPDMEPRDPIFISNETRSEIQEDIREFYRNLLIGGSR